MFKYQDSTEPLTPTDRQSLLKRSGYEQFIALLQDTFPNNALDAIQYGGTAKAMKSWLLSLIQQISDRKVMTQEAYESSRDKRQIQRLETLRSRTLANQEPQKQRLRDFILSETEKIRVDENDKLKALLEDICQRLQNEIRSINDLERLENLAAGEMSGRVRASLTKPINEHFARISQDIQNVYQTLLQRIREYSSVNQESINIENIQIDRSQPLNRY